MIGSVSVKEKFRIVLNQRGKFVCLRGVDKSEDAESSDLDHVIADLRKRGRARPATVTKLPTVKAALNESASQADVNRLIKGLQS